MKLIALITILGLVGIFDGKCQDRVGFKFRGGSGEGGKEAFQNLNCTQCHVVKGVEFEKAPAKRLLDLSLGKEIRFVKKYEDILTAITNPQHVVNEQYSAILSKAELAGGIEAYMPNLIEDMSVKQLMDLAAFLNQVYSSELDGYLK